MRQVLVAHALEIVSKVQANKAPYKFLNEIKLVFNTNVLQTKIEIILHKQVLEWCLG